jgi:hypothetical protein
LIDGLEAHVHPVFEASDGLAHILQSASTPPGGLEPTHS